MYHATALAPQLLRAEQSWQNLFYWIYIDSLYTILLAIIRILFAICSNNEDLNFNIIQIPLQLQMSHTAPMTEQWNTLDWTHSGNLQL